MKILDVEAKMYKEIEKSSKWASFLHPPEMLEIRSFLNFPTTSANFKQWVWFKIKDPLLLS